MAISIPRRQKAANSKTAPKLKPMCNKKKLETKIKKNRHMISFLSAHTQMGKFRAEKSVKSYQKSTTVAKNQEI